MNQIYSPDYRKTVLDMYASGKTVKEIDRLTSVSRSTVFMWINEAGIPRHRNVIRCLTETPMDKNKEIEFMTLIEKKKLVDGFIASKNKSQYARDHHIPRGTLYRWSKQNDIIQAYNGKTINVKMYLEACRTIEKKQRIIDVLQSVHCTVFAPLQVRMSEMDRLNGEYGKNVLCDALRVDHGTYANHLKRNKREKSWFVTRREELKSVIENTYHEFDQILGIRKIHGCLHRALDEAVQNEYIVKNPSSGCKMPKVVTKEIKPLDLPDQKKLFASLEGAYYAPLFITAIFTGMRVGELIGLEWDCVDLVNGCIHVNKQLVQTRKKGQDYKFGSLKNGKTRTITPAKYVIDILTNHRIDQEIEKNRAKDLWNPGNFPNLVFTHPDGSHLSQPTVWKEFQKILQAAGLEHYRVHDLRHTFAVNSIMAGDDIKTLQENMGHYSAAFTLDRYGHVTETMKKASANRMQVFIEQLQEV